MAEYQKPLPVVDTESREYWAGCKRHELLIQRCKDCGTYVHFPDPLCSNCLSTNREFVESKGKGKIYSFIISYVTAVPGYQDDLPLVHAWVTLDDIPGVRCFGLIKDLKPKPEEIQEMIKCEMPVEVDWVDMTDEVALPMWKLVK